MSIRYDFALDTRRLRDELGFAAPVPLGEALRHTVRWQRAHPPEAPPAFDYAAEDAALSAAGL